VFLGTFLARAVARAGQPIRWLAAPQPRLERLIGLELGPADRTALASALEADGARLGHYYAWYLEKLLVARRVRRGSRAEMLRFVRSTDATNLQAVDRAISHGSGTVLALPHYGHYILCAVSLIMHIGETRDVGIFYGEPGTHRGNEVFDRLYEALFKDRSPNVHVYHSNRQGMAGALRLLKAGGVLIMMPDVHQKRDEAFAIPFLGLSLDVMLGTAALARKTGSALIPILPLGKGAMRFRTRVGRPVNTGHIVADADADAGGNQRECFLDYAATCAVFDRYQRWMSGTCIQWQYVREHFARRAPFVELAPDVVERIWNDFLNDPRVRGHDAKAFRLPLE